jgi:hypothetical protein
MSRYLLVGFPGDASLKLVDLEAGTVESIPSSGVDEAVAKVRESGATVLKDVDLAIAIDDRADAVGRFFFDGGSVR